MKQVELYAEKLKSCTIFSTQKKTVENQKLKILDKIQG